jgi:hypothetical protein
MTGEGFNKFLEISKLPLWLLAIAAPFSVVVARAHGTAQTAYQINELEIKNNQENYYRHRDDVIQTLNEALQEYLKTTKSVVNSEELPDQIIRSSLYQRLFTSTEKIGIGKITNEKLELLVNEFNATAESGNDFIESIESDNFAYAYQHFNVRLISNLNRIYKISIFDVKREDFTIGAITINMDKILIRRLITLYSFYWSSITVIIRESMAANPNIKFPPQDLATEVRLKKIIPTNKEIQQINSRIQDHFNNNSEA